MRHPTAPRRLRLLAAAAVVSVLTLAGCAGADSSPQPTSADASASAGLLADQGLEGLDATQVIERLDTMTLAERPSDLIASVQPDAVVVTDDQGREARLPMPEDQVYVSVAPYVDQTHECHFHSLTTCLGELGDESVDVTLTTADGEVLVDETRRTYDNGFVGLWVPRDLDATLTITHDGRTGTAPITTRDADDPTCVTTLQLT